MNEKQFTSLEKKLQLIQKNLSSIKSLDELKQLAKKMQISIRTVTEMPLTRIELKLNDTGYMFYGNVNMFMKKLFISDQEKTVEMNLESGFRIHGGFNAKILDVKILNCIKESLKKI